jgi:hypothetical protein
MAHWFTQREHMKLETFVHEDRLYIIHDQPFDASPRLVEYEGDLTIKFDDGTQTKIDAPQIEEPDAILEAAIVLAEGTNVKNGVGVAFVVK